MKEKGFSEYKEIKQNKNVLESIPIVEDNRSFKELLDLKIDKDQLKEADKKLSINEITGLNEEQKNQIKEEQGWSDEIIDNIKYVDKNMFNNDNKELSEKTGGSYGEVFKEGLGDKYEVHHMPADNVNGLERKDGPAIRMDKEDHRETASCGNSREAREYRAHQKELIEQGKFREALEMDIDDIRGKFGDKYDDAILEMLQYVDKLEMEGRI